ncbi:MAG: low molecular weight phosphotyrosine protein phosphatase [Bacteroidetes bacterium]|nr:low molecular weight phosphotyrosine protein phosphatase [Bacteroidota bacterium]
MVCLGNICRSPIAEGVLKFKAKQHGLDWQIDSAGTESYHIGEPPHRFSQKICLTHGIDISGQRARQFVVADFNYYDKIYAMASDVYDEIVQIGDKQADINKVSLLMNEVYENANISVPDPWYGDEAGYTPVFDMIDKACEAIIEKGIR